MTIDDMQQAITDAEAILRRARSVYGRMAGMLDGHLREVDSAYTLRRLKNELREFNAHTGRWNG